MKRTFSLKILCFRLLSSFATSDGEDLEELCDSIANNEIAVEAISERLTEVTGLAEELDQAIHSAQQDCLVFSTASTSTTSLTEPINTISTVCKAMENNPTNPEVSLLKLKYGDAIYSLCFSNVICLCPSG